jgi:hypothetical protein
MPTRIRRILLAGQDEVKTLWFKSSAASCETELVFTLRVPAPSLIWVHERGSGDMMIDGVPGVRAAEGVRPLILSGKSTQQRGGGRKIAGAGRRHQLYGQGTCATHG